MRKFKILILSFLFLHYLSSAQLVVGRYIGNGAATKAITGLGGTPDILIVKSVASTSGWITTSNMTAGEAKHIAGGASPNIQTNCIQSLDASGFTVKLSDESNKTGVVYFYLAWSDNDGNAKIGTFDGAVAGQSVNIGFQPEWVILWGNNCYWNDRPRFTMKDEDNQDKFFSNGWPNAADAYFVGHSATGFDVQPGDGTKGIVNGCKYWYTAFNVAVSTYVADGVDNREVNMGYQPDFVMTSSRNSWENPWMKTRTMGGDTCVSGNDFRVIADGTRSIREITANGFRLGLNGEVNSAGVTVRYFGMTAAATLPVELINFQGKLIDDKIVLNWETASEIDNSHFEVYGSIDGKHWENLGQVPGAGNSYVLNKYEFETFETQYTYFKLKQVDFNGDYEFSKIISINGDMDKNGWMNIYPNPSIAEVNLDINILKYDQYKLQVFDLNGKEVEQKNLHFKLGINYLKLNIENYSSGTYQILITSKSGEKFSKTVVKP